MSERVSVEQHEEEVCFARCGNCGRMKWISQAALKAGLSWGCKYDGSRMLVQVRHVTVLERLWLVKWIFWEHLQLNPGEMWYLNPLNVWKIVMMGMRPKLHQGPTSEEIKATDEQRKNDERRQREDSGSQERPAHSHS